MKKKVVKGYKAFSPGLKCRDFQYEIGKTYETDKVEICRTGFHYCENPMDVLKYYPLVGSEFAEIEALGNVVTEDEKSATDKIFIKAKLDFSAWINASVEFIFSKAKVSESGNATSGSRAHSATSGYGAHSATSGNDAHSATSGSRANSATSGEYAHSATSGSRANSATSGYGAHSATSGYGAHSATSGNDAHSATSGEYAHSATSGSRANSATSGYGAHSATSGNDAIVCAVGRKSKAKASLGCFIVLAEWKEGKEFADAKPLAIKSAKVDGKKVKADQWYKLVDGKFIETDDSNE